MKQATLPHVAAPLRTAMLLAVLALLAAACGGKSQPAKQASTASSAHPTTSMGQMAMELPPGTEHMKVAITAPANGATLTANQVTLKVTTSGYTDTCDLAGKPTVNATTGHYHVLLDKSLINMYCTPTATVSMQNLKPGRHTLTVVPALNDHVEVEDNARSITILSPTPGATVSGPFDVTVQLNNFNASCALYGKPGVAGYGHWHLNLDTSTGPMMGMGSMLGMSCQRTFHASTAGLKPGQTHTLIALLVDNAHAPLHPAVESKVEVRIG